MIRIQVNSCLCLWAELTESICWENDQNWSYELLKQRHHSLWCQSQLRRIWHQSHVKSTFRFSSFLLLLRHSFPSTLTPSLRCILPLVGTLYYCCWSILNSLESMSNIIDRLHNRNELRNLELIEATQVSRLGRKFLGGKARIL